MFYVKTELNESATMLTKCVELWVFGSRITSGMEREIANAKQRDMPIRYFDEDMEEHTNG